MMKSKFFAVFLVTFLSSFMFFTMLLPSVVSAKAKVREVKPSEITKVFSANNKTVGGKKERRTQGATITQKYYVYTMNTWPTAPERYGIIHFINRSTGKESFKIQKKEFSHLSSLRHKWGSDYIFVNQGSTYCIKISTQKVLAKKY